MPNHVHALIETREGFPLADVLHSWKSFTSHKANGLLQRNGEFWQREYLDRYVRNAEHYKKVVVYIEENPVKSGLVRLKTDWLWSSATVSYSWERCRPGGELIRNSTWERRRLAGELVVWFLFETRRRDASAPRPAEIHNRYKIFY